ncbi:MAG: hypothetical protein ACLGG0_05320 [Bacteriovoracia bacterium]
MNVVMAYVGDDPDMIKGLQLLVESQTRGANSWKLSIFNPSEFSFHLLTTVPDLRLVVYDFTQDVVLSEKFCLQMQLFRSQVPWRYVPLVGVFSSLEHLESHRFVFTLGLSYSHIKGADASILSSDCAWLITGNEAYLGDFATCKDLLLPYHIEVLSALVELSAEKLVIDTDVFSENPSNINCLAFGDQIPHGLELVSSAECGRWSDTFYKMDYTITYPGPWDEVKESTLMRDTVETWVEQNQTPPIASAFIYTKNIELIREIIREPIVDKYNVFCFNHDERLSARIVSLMPQLMCLEISNDDDSAELLNSVNQALATLPEWKPFIILYNTALSLEMARLSIQSERLITYDKKLEFNILKDLLLVSSRKLQLSSVIPEVCMPWNSPDRVVSFDLPITVQNISEHEISFFCPSEIPMFTVLRLQRPVLMYVMIIPAHKVLVKEGLGTLYRGIIHGLDHDGEEILRSYVNASIFSTPKQFGIIEEVVVVEENPVESEMTTQDNRVVGPIVESEVAILPAIRCRVKKGKSKL